MEFFCENAEAECACDKIWKGRIGQIRQHGDTIEMEISGKGSSLYAIIGKYAYGKYLCIPGWGIASPLAELDDCFWNREQLEKRIGRVDAITVSEAIKTLSKHVEDVG